MMRKISEAIVIAVLILMGLILGGCSSSFKADLNNPVDASVNIGQMQTIQSDAGVLYDWFSLNNAFNEDEGRKVQGYYDEMLRVITKLRKKAVAGQVDYHRLLYAVEDLTDAWEDLRPALQQQVDIVASGNDQGRLEDRLAISMWNRLSADMDSILGSSNATLKNAKGELDDATYAAFKDDAQGIISTLSPLFKIGMGRFGL